MAAGPAPAPFRLLWRVCQRAAAAGGLRAPNGLGDTRADDTTGEIRPGSPTLAWPKMAARNDTPTLARHLAGLRHEQCLKECGRRPR